MAQYTRLKSGEKIDEDMIAHNRMNGQNMIATMQLSRAYGVQRQLPVPVHMKAKKQTNHFNLGSNKSTSNQK